MKCIVSLTHPMEPLDGSTPNPILPPTPLPTPPPIPIPDEGEEGMGDPIATAAVGSPILDTTPVPVLPF